MPSFTTPFTARARPDDGSTVRIADLIAQAGRDAAQIQLRRGDIAAQGAQNLGQIAGNGLMSIAKFAQEGPIRAQEAQLRNLQIQEGQGTLAAQKQKVTDQQTIDKILSTAGDPVAMQEAAAQSGNAHVWPQIQDFLDRHDEAVSKLASAKTNAEAAQAKVDTEHLDYVGGLMSDVAKHDYDPAVFSAAVSHAFLHGSLDKAAGGQLIARSIQQPDSIKAMTDAGIAASPTHQKAAATADAELMKPREVPEGGKVVVPGLAGKPTTIAEGNPKSGPNSQEADFRLDGKDVKGSYVPGVGGQGGRYLYNGVDVTSRVQKIPTAAAVNLSTGALTDTALDKAAVLYNTTHTLPPGYGAAAMTRNTKIMNRAGELDPTAALAANAAIFKADSANLTKLQTTEGALSAFENAAGKNIKQFTDLAAKLPDTGVPWLNTPLRLLTDKAVGAEWLPAVQAARKIALREVARVTNDPGLRGQLTDSARADVNDMADGNATLAQMKRVFPVLLADMANVHTGMKEEIAAVKDRLGSNTTPPTPAQGGGWTDVGGGVRIREKK